jgi:DNA repair ATPase RecN
LAFAEAQSSSEVGLAKARARSTCFINGAATPLKNLRKLGAALVDVNAQNAGISLRSAATQRCLLDHIAGVTPLAARFAACLQQLKAVTKRLSDLQCDLHTTVFTRGHCHCVMLACKLSGSDRDAGCIQTSLASCG